MDKVKLEMNMTGLDFNKTIDDVWINLLDIIFVHKNPLLVEPEEECFGSESDRLSPFERWNLMKKLFWILRPY